MGLNFYIEEEVLIPDRYRNLSRVYTKIYRYKLWK